MTTRPMPLLLILARQTLGWTQRELGENLGSSQRTATRWEGGSSHFGGIYAARLVQHLYAVNRDIAAELAAATGQTLVGLGLETPPLPVPPPAGPQATVLRDLIEAIVCSAADVANVAPKVVRPTVLFTLQRAAEAGLDLRAASAAGLFVIGGGSASS